jgi:hypothetical protein
MKRYGVTVRDTLLRLLSSPQRPPSSGNSSSEHRATRAGCGSGLRRSTATGCSVSVHSRFAPTVWCSRSSSSDYQRVSRATPAATTCAAGVRTSTREPPPATPLIAIATERQHEALDTGHEPNQIVFQEASETGKQNCRRSKSLRSVASTRPASGRRSISGSASMYRRPRSATSCAGNRASTADAVFYLDPAAAARTVPLKPSDPAYWMLEQGRNDPSKRSKTDVFDKDCYICRDPEFAMMGLPLCYACPTCGGHIAADDCVCANGHDAREEEGHEDHLS